MVVVVKIGGLDMFLACFQFRGQHIGKAVLKGLYLLYAPAQLRLIAVASAADAVEHQSGILAHGDRLAAKCYDRRHARRHAVNVHMYVSHAPFKGIEYGYAAVDVAADGVDAHIDPGTGFLGCFQLRRDIAAFDITVITDLPIKENCHAAVRGCMYIQISVHYHRI